MTNIKEKAKKIVTAFQNKPSKYCGAFSLIERTEVAQGLSTRIQRPGQISQRSSSLCGPASLLFSVARTRPNEYAQFVVDLADKGDAKLGKLRIEPGQDLKRHLPAKGSIDPSDWIALASIRDSENWFFDYQSASDQVAGITIPSSLASWYKKAGYTDIRNETNLYFIKDEANANMASTLYRKGFKVALFISANMLDTKSKTTSSTTPDHWVVLTSKIKIGANVSFTVYTWGDPRRRVPQTGSLSKKDFLNNYYGYVACKH